MAGFSYKFLRTGRKAFLPLFACFSVLLSAGCGSEFKILLDKDWVLPLVISAYNSGNEMRIFWSEKNGSIKRTNPNRNAVNTLISTAGVPLDISLYVPGQKIYWTEDKWPDYLIKYANLDGTGEETLTSQSQTPFPHLGPAEIAVDPNAGIIYWGRYNASSLHNDILRSNLSDFSGITWVTNITQLYPYTFCMALDTVNRKLYFTVNNYWDINTIYGSGQTGRMYTAQMDTAEVKSHQFTVFSEINPSVALRGIAVDSAHRFVYYVSNAVNLTIIRADLSFQNQTVWITANEFDIQKLALDLKDGMIYWTSRSDNSIYRAKTDRPESGVERFLQASGEPTGIAISD